MQEILEFREIEIPERNPNPVNDIYKKNGAEGTAYPGVVTEVEDYRTRCGTARFGALKVQEYSIQVKYSDTDFWVSGLETDPRKCLENPYCSVYVWKEKAIATDFKVRGEYIAPNGKTHLIAPRKKNAKK